MGTSSQGDDTTELLERFKSELRRRGIELDSGAEDELFSLARQLSELPDRNESLRQIQSVIPPFVALAVRYAESQRQTRNLDPQETFLLNRDDLRSVFLACDYCRGPHARLFQRQMVR